MSTVTVHGDRGTIATFQEEDLGATVHRDGDEYSHSRLTDNAGGSVATTFHEDGRVRVEVYHDWNRTVDLDIHADRGVVDVIKGTVAQPVLLIYDEAEENKDIIWAVKNEDYPPTNPAVLLRAARWAYLEGRHDDMVTVLAWTDTVIKANS